MLRRHSGPSVAAATLAVLAFLAVDVCAQDASGVMPVVPGAPSTAAPTTQRVVPVPADAASPGNAPPAPSVAGPEAAAPAVQPMSPVAQTQVPAAAATTPVAAPVEVPSAQASPADQQTPSVAAPPSAAEAPVVQLEAPAADASSAQQMPEAIADEQVAPPSDTPSESATDVGWLESVIESYLPGLLPKRNENLPHDLSPIGMFLAADWVVKGVMISLAFASLVTWTVWIAKTVQLTGAKARASSGIKAIGNSRALADALEVLGQRGGTVAAMVRIANHEVRLSDAAIDHAGGDGVKERVGSALGRIEVQAGRNISKGTGVLATIGSTAPFVGLFGTVWGIMNSFIGISESQTTNLAVVAPGIAEALLATAIGLVAAIPAVIIYNVFARSVTAYRQSLADAAAGIERLVSRDLDFRKIPVEARNPKIKLVTE